VRNEERESVPKRQEPERPAELEHIERRRQPRDPQATVNWETIVLQRMAERIKSLSGDAAPDAEAPTEGGWENAALRTLQRRMQDLESQ